MSFDLLFFYLYSFYYLFIIITLLLFVIIFLQAIVLTRTISGYKQKVHSSEGAIQQTLNILKANLESSANKGSVSLARSEVASQIRLLEDALERISTNCALPEETPWVAQAYTPNTTFLKANQNPSIADFTKGSTKHLNITHVTKLEQRLCTLYGDLTMFLESLQTKNNGDTSRINSKLINSLQKACEDLQQLSFLVPSVPWARRQCLPEVTVDDVMKALPKLTSTKHKDVRDLLAAVLKLSEYRYCLLENKYKRQQVELDYLRGNETQVSTRIKSTSAGLLSELSNYHESIKDTLVIPLQGLLQTFESLSNSPTDDNLKTFLQEFKEHSAELLKVCETIRAHELTDDIVKVSEKGYAKNLRKTLKELKSEKLKFEDRESELIQDERETRDEVIHRVGQLSVSSTQVKVKPFDISQSRSDNPNPSRVNPSPAHSLLSKYEKVEKNVEKKFSVNSKTERFVVKDEHPVQKEPTWFQEMKDDLPVQAPTKLTRPSVKRTARK